MNTNEQMREALNDIGNACAWIAENCGNEQIATYMWDLIEKVKAVLPLPRRNCDVGTAEEQAKRFSFFCMRYHGCGKCPLNKGRKDCKFSWAQMPYDESEAPK